MTFYETLALAMSKKSMTAADLSAATGIHPSYFSKLKSGHTKDVTWEKALIIINALEMTPDEFSALQNNTAETMADGGLAKNNETHAQELGA